jgi:hypothetical protein
MTEADWLCHLWRGDRGEKHKEKGIGYARPLSSIERSLHLDIWFYTEINQRSLLILCGRGRVGTHISQK